MTFNLHSKYKPTGDQPAAIDTIVENYQNGEKEQILLGATGTGKTFTMANVIKKMGKKTLILSPNKTLAGQLYAEMKEFFPNNRVEYFISNFDYYRPEAYKVSSDTYIEKDASQNEELDQMRYSALESLINHDDTIVVASVSAIYGIGDPSEYQNRQINIRCGDIFDRDELIKTLIELTYTRNNLELGPGMFRVNGDIVEIQQKWMDNKFIRLEFFDDEIEQISVIDSVTKDVINNKEFIAIAPASMYVAPQNQMESIIKKIKQDLQIRVAELEAEDKLVEAQRLQQRTHLDMEMLSEVGICSGVENYSLYLTSREVGEAPYTLIDYFGDDYLLILDESHLLIPQLNGMYNGDRSRKENLVDYGFRLPSALDNRPLKFNEFEQRTDKILYVSATPGEYELNKELAIAQQIIRPTGLLDPTFEIRPTKGQIDKILFDIKEKVNLNERVIITTITKKMAEDLTDYLKGKKIKVGYLHSDIQTLERLYIINQLRRGEIDVLIGINLLREGLDMPEVSLMCIIDADKEGFLRNTRSLLQIFGRVARNEHGHVVMYADRTTKSMEEAMEETRRRREVQNAYNIEHNITPKTIIKKISEDMYNVVVEYSDKISKNSDIKLSPHEIKKEIEKLEKRMKRASKELDFEQAIQLRDIILELKAKL